MSNYSIQGNTGGARIDEEILPAQSLTNTTACDATGNPLSVLSVNYDGFVPDDGFPPSIAVSNSRRSASYYHRYAEELKPIQSLMKARTLANQRADAAETDLRLYRDNVMRDVICTATWMQRDNVLVRAAVWLASLPTRIMDSMFGAQS